MFLTCLDSDGKPASRVAYCFLGGGVLNKPPDAYALVFKGLPMYLLTRLLAMTCWLGKFNVDDLLLLQGQHARKSDWLSEELKEAACLHCRDEIRSLLSSLLERTDEVVAAL